MENTNIVFKYFDNALVQRVLDLNDITDIDVRMALKDEIIETYKGKDVALKAEIVTQLAEAKARHLNNISELETICAYNKEFANSIIQYMDVVEKTSQTTIGG